MTRFWRDGHWRVGPQGDEHWVEGHWVDRTDWNRESYLAAPANRFIFRARLTYERFTRSTHCPVCGANVFFVVCPNGGRVFFQALGVPWDKHPCTSNDPIAQSAPSRPLEFSASPPKPYKWQEEGWDPIGIEAILQEDEWFVLKCTRLRDDELVRLLTPLDPGNLRRVPAMLSRWSTDDFATLSFLDDDGEPQYLIVAKYSAYCLTDPSTVEFRRALNHS